MLCHVAFPAPLQPLTSCCGAALCVLLGWSLIQFIFPLGPIGQTVFALGGAILFALYLIMDTHLLIEKFSCEPPALAARAPVP